MARKIILFGTFLGLIFVISNYYFLTQKQPENAEKEITIFTLNTLAGIHAKMILWDNGIVTLGTAEKLSEKEKALMRDSDIVIDVVPIEQSPMNWELQGYRWLYVMIPALPKEKIFHTPDTLSEQIDSIRDIFIDRDPRRQGYYYDNAGNYTHLLQTLNESTQTRFWKYHKVKFVTIGAGFESFTAFFWLSDYHFKNYINVWSFVSDKSIKDSLKSQEIKHVFVSLPLSDMQVKDLEKRYHVTVYRLPHIEEDTSSWGYLRYVEKISDEFVRAFDTYD